MGAVEILVSTGRVHISNLPTADSTVSDELITAIKIAVRDTDFRGVGDSVVCETFFENPVIRHKRASDGIVKTPKSLARFIVSSAFRRWRACQTESSTRARHPRWLDPCSGAGVFSTEILAFYCEELDARRVSDLPDLTFVELSPIGLAVTLCNIKLELQKRDLDFSKYLTSGKIKFYSGDFLKLFPESPELFSPENAFDIVVGNPPYVRATRLSREYKNLLSSLFPTVYAGNADLYTYFIAGAITHLRKNGVLAYISSAAFTRSSSGKTVRNWLRNNATVESYVDLDETKVFDEVSVHSAIYVLAKRKNQPRAVAHLQISSSNELKQMFAGKSPVTLATFDRNSDGWSFYSSDAELKEFSKIFVGTTSLSDQGIKVYSGIRPGHMQAFILTRDEVERFSIKVRKKWFRKIVLSANIARWNSGPTLDYLLFIPSGTKEIDRELIEYLQPYKSKLSTRPETRGSTDWYSLRPCSYYSHMDKRKIAFPDIAARQRFAIVESGTYVADGAYFIDTASLTLLGILNSSTAMQYFLKRCSSVGNLSRNGRFRFKKAFVQDFPIPLGFGDGGSTQLAIEALVEEILSTEETASRKSELDRLVSRLYSEAR